MSNYVISVVFSFFTNLALFFSSFSIACRFWEACFALSLRALIGRFDEDTIVDLKVDLIVSVDLEIDDSRDERELELEIELIVIVDIIVNLEVDFVELKVKL